jgi:hypothetical protein
LWTCGMQDMFLEQLKGLFPLGLLDKTLRSKITTIITRVEESWFGQERVRPRVRLDVKVNLRKPERIRHIVYSSTSNSKRSPPPLSKRGFFGWLLVMESILSPTKAAASY